MGSVCFFNIPGPRQKNFRPGDEDFDMSLWFAGLTIFQGPRQHDLFMMQPNHAETLSTKVSGILLLSDSDRGWMNGNACWLHSQCISFMTRKEKSAFLSVGFPYCRVSKRTHAKLICWPARNCGAQKKPSWGGYTPKNPLPQAESFLSWVAYARTSCEHTTISSTAS